MTQKLSDSELYQLCKMYGQSAREWMRKFAGLLPEVYRRRLYKRRGYASIHEFAAKLAGMSERNVDRILRLSKKLEDKPTLKEQFESGSASYSKIETVAYVATAEDEGKWAKRVEEMPRLALEECVRNNREEVTPGGNSEPEKWNRLSFPVSPEVEFKLRQLKQKLEKEQGEAKSFNEVLEELFKNGPTQEKKKTTIQICPDCIQKRAKKAGKNRKTKRYRPREIDHLVYLRQKHKCAEPDCNHPAEIIHHKRPWAFSKSHDPDSLVALCKKHEQLTHADQSEHDWEMRVINQKVAEHRNGP